MSGRFYLFIFLLVAFSFFNFNVNPFYSLLSPFQNDELRKKLGDFNKVNKVQASLNDHNSSLEQEIKQLNAK